MVQPVYGPQWGDILRDALGAYSTINQMERQSAEDERRQKVTELMAQAQDDPRKADQLRALDYTAWRKYQEGLDMRRQYQMNKLKDSASFAMSIEGMSPQQKSQAFMQRAEDLKQRGEDPTNAIKLAKAYASGKGHQADQVLSQTVAYAQKQGLTTQNAFTSKLIAAGYKPGTPEFKEAARQQLSKTGQTINIGGADQGVFAKELAKSQIKKYEEVQGGATQAEEQLYSLNELEAMDVQQGALEPMKVQLGAIGESMGMDMSSIVNVPAGQAYNAQAKKMVLGEMQKQKGPQTESDMRLIRQTVAGLGQTPEANKFLIQSAKAQALRKVEQRDFYENYLEVNGNLNGASKAWNDYKRKVPMISKNIKVNGMPVFYYQFEQDVREANPDATREQIIEAWKKKDEAARTAPKIAVEVPYRAMPAMQIRYAPRRD